MSVVRLTHLRHYRTHDKFREYFANRGPVVYALYHLLFHLRVFCAQLASVCYTSLEWYK